MIATDIVGKKVNIEEVSVESRNVWDSVIEISRQLDTLGLNVVSDKYSNTWWNRLSYKFLQPIQKKSEICCLLDILRSNNPDVIVEIGLGAGGTHLLFKSVAKVVVSIDNNAGHIWRTAWALDNINQTKGSILLNGNSENPKVQEQINDLIKPQKIDVLFIDGSHTEEQVIADFNSFHSLLNSKYIIAMHDLHLPHVFRGMRKIAEIIKIKPEVIVDSTDPLGIAIFKHKRSNHVH